VRAFLSDAVSKKLTVHQKQQIIQRFFTLLAGESTEEIKTLSIQLVVYPMLQASFQEAKAESKRGVVSTGTEPGREDADTEAAPTLDFIDASVVKKFIHEVLFQDGKQIVCGDRLRVELLKLSNVFLEYVSSYVEELGKDLIKFCWALLKSDDASCKNWAYVVVCRLISVLEAPSKIILQVYVALLRSHQQEGKNLVRAALDLLVPALPIRLQEKELRKMFEFTNRIMFEEGNSIPQLSHVWHTIVNHPEVFYYRRHQFVPYMINSLNRLGLPPNCPPENRALAVTIVELVVGWAINQGKKTANYSSGPKRRAGDLPEVDSQDAHADKKRKTSTGVVGVASKKAEDSIFSLDQSMVSILLHVQTSFRFLSHNHWKGGYDGELFGSLENSSG
jgi:transformation/transcription domain-associated protein